MCVWDLGLPMCGGLTVLDPESSTIQRNSIVGLGLALLEVVGHCEGGQ